MKKVYEAPKMLVEVVCVDEILRGSGSLNIFDEQDEKVEDEASILTKDRNDNWGGLLW